MEVVERAPKLARRQTTGTGKRKASSSESDTPVARRVKVVLSGCEQVLKAGPRATVAPMPHSTLVTGVIRPSDFHVIKCGLILTSFHDTSWLWTVLGDCVFSLSYIVCPEVPPSWLTDLLPSEVSVSRELGSHSAVPVVFDERFSRTSAVVSCDVWVRFAPLRRGFDSSRLHRRAHGGH